MTRRELLSRIETIVNAGEGTLTGSEPLEELPEWDSLSVLSVISLYDKEFGVVVKPTTVYECQTVGSVMDLIGDRLTP
jgi:acyl carrier protein